MDSVTGAIATFFVVVITALVLVLLALTYYGRNIITINMFTIACFTVLIALITIVTVISKANTNPNNPTNNTTDTNNVQSTVTYTSLGKRGDSGNQMFQIACAVAAAKRSNAKLVLPTILKTLPIYELLDLQSIELQDLQVDKYYREQENYEHITIPADGLTYDIRGYRQATKYFADTDIRQLFTPKAVLLEKMRAILPPEYIAVHIRRGDYVKTIHKVPLLREFRRCQLAYYQAAIKVLRKDYPSCPVLICTDSPQWVQPLLKDLDDKAVLAPIPSDIKPKFADFCTLYLATSIVISNSTYSWWAAYLNNKRSIIAPTPWWDPDGFIGSAYRLHGNWLHFPEMQLLDADNGEPRTVENITDNTEPLLIYKVIRGMLI